MNKLVNEIKNHESHIPEVIPKYADITVDKMKGINIRILDSGILF